jgi:two-component system, NarL family, sensor histidine kinase DegS
VAGAEKRMNTAAFGRASELSEGQARAREDERRRLARELHDGPAQALAAALFGVDMAIRAVDQAPGAARDELLAARDLIRDALDDVRALIVGLRPRPLEERGLVAALQSLAAMPPLWGTAVTVETRGIDVDQRLPAETELALFRISQEAVSNARRHGAASRVMVSLTVGPERAELLVGDDGHGFSRSPDMPVIDLGEGLSGMRERVALLGGEFRVESAPGVGTQVSVSVPLPSVLGTQMGSKEREL